MTGKRLHSLGLIFGVALGALVLSACAQTSTPPGGAGGTEPAASTSGTHQRGGTITFPAGAASYGGTDPAMGQASYNVWPIIGEYLLLLEPETWKLVPAAIERWEQSPDGLTLTLHLRKGMKFHNKPPVNGREVEAKDVVYTLKGITGQLYPNLPSVRFPRRSNYEEMVDAVALDRYTVKVTLSSPSSTFLQGLAEYRSAVVLPDGLREAFGGIESLVTPDVARYIAAGPFLLTSFTNNVEVEYERNPDYYDLAADGQPKPFVDKVRYIWIPDKGTENAAFIAGQIDYLAFRAPDDRDFVVQQKPDAAIVTYAPSSCWYRLAFNVQRKPFDDVRVRKAIALVMDPVAAGKQFFGDWEGQPVWRYPGPLPWVFPEAIPQEELAKLPGYRLPKDQDIAEARRLLAEAGLGNGFEFEMMGTTTSAKDFGALAQNQIMTALPGVKINLKIVDNAINHQLSAKGEFDTQYYCYIHEPTAVGMLKTAFHTKGGRNYPRFSDARMDELLDQASRELDQERRRELLRQAQMRALEMVPFMPTLHNAAQVALQPHVRGLRYGAATSPLVWYKEAWLER